MHFALNYPVHSGSFKFDDTDLRDNDLVRIYDVVIPYSDGLMATDELTCTPAHVTGTFTPVTVLKSVIARASSRAR